MPWNMAAASTDFPLGSVSVESAIGPSTGAPLVDETRYHTPCHGGRGATVSMKLTPLNWWGAWSKRYRSFPAYVTWSPEISVRWTRPRRDLFTPGPATG